MKSSGSFVTPKKNERSNMTCGKGENEMPKFNMEKLKGFDAKDNVKSEGKPYKVGAGLLNEVSKSQTKETKICYITRNEIEKNKKNEYSISDIESLMWSISQMGLLQPLHVMPLSNGNYKLLGGERRLTAIDRLIEDPTVEKWTDDTLIPCVVKDPKDMELPLSDELKEIFAIVTTNKEARKYTDADRLMEIREWKRIIEALRENGVESIPYPAEDGEEQQIVIRGEKTRDILAKATGLSRGSINKFEKLEKQGNEAVKKAVMEGDASVHTASEMIDMLNEQEQIELVEDAKKTGEVITVQHVKEKAEKREESNTLTVAKFQKDLKPIMKRLKAIEVCLDEERQMRYNNCIKELKQLLYEEK